jgi:hypothetical protein
MTEFIDQYRDQTYGTLMSGFDRLVFPQFIKTAQLWVLGCEREGIRVNGNGAMPLAEQNPVQGLLLTCEWVEPTTEGLLHETIRRSAFANTV